MCSLRNTIICLLSISFLMDSDFWNRNLNNILFKVECLDVFFHDESLFLVSVCTILSVGRIIFECIKDVVE